MVSEPGPDGNDVESFVRRRVGRTGLRHLKQLIPLLRTVVDCSRCNRRRECNGTCPGIELLLIAETVSTGTLPDDKRKADPKALEAALQYLASPPFALPSSYLGGFVASTDSLDSDIIEAIIDGKPPLEEIASENGVNLEYVQHMCQRVKDLLGLASPVLKTEWQRITRALIDERLSTSVAADTYGVSSSYISKVKRKAKDEALALWHQGGDGGSFGSLFP